MNIKSIAFGLALALAAVAPAEAQRGGGAGNWELLGEERVGFGADRDVITLRNDENFYRNKAYRRLRFVAEGGEVRMRSIRLTYLNGHAEDVQFDKTLRAGQEVDVDLRGERSYLRQIEMVYKAKFGISLGQGGVRLNQPTIKVLGDNVRGGPPGRPEPGPGPRPGAGGWDTLASERFSVRDEEVQMRVGRRDGRIGQIRLQNRGERINVREVRIRFGNGETQVVRLGQRLEDGEQSRPIDVEGATRFIQSVTVLMDASRRRGQTELTLLGTERPGREDGPGPGAGGGYRPRPDWVPLGQQSVGFGVDRDVIRVGQSEDFFRNRGFDKLHFVAEGNDLHMMSIRVVYLNGHAEDIRIDRNIRAGSDLAVDLPGRRSYLREIEMIYRGRPGFGGRAGVSVFGEPSQRRF